MDEFYDREAAARALQEHTISRTALRPECQLATISIQDMQIAKSDGSMSWRLSEYDSNTGSIEEAALRLQGIISAEILPPVSKNSNSDTKRYRPYMRQAVTLTGLGCETFNKCYENVQQIYMAFSNTFPQGALEGWQDSKFEEYPALNSNARYFSRVMANTDKSMSIPFGDNVDPEGVLERLVDDEYIHGPDNHVEYKWRIITKDGAAQYKPICPVNIRIGDIVELSISFVVFPAKEKKHFKMIPILKGILLLDNKARTDAAILRMRYRTSSKPAQHVKVKRRQVFDEDEELEDTERKFIRMKISVD